MFDFITETYHRLIEELDAPKHRDLYSHFKLDDRLIGIIGPRGVGKTTLLLQYIKENLYKDGKAYYFSADLVYFNQTSLLQFVSELYQNAGCRAVFIDEIHKYKNWNQELKNLYDVFPQLQIVFSGSSMLDLVYGSHDLSRRARLYHLRGLSFREYLDFFLDTALQSVAWDDLLKGLQNPLNKALATTAGVLPAFRNYLKMGYYPFAKENPSSFYEKLGRIIDKTIYEDIANFYKLNTGNLQYFKKILIYTATIPPGRVSMHNLSKHLGIDHKTVGHYAQILSDVGLMRQLLPPSGGSSAVRKPAKLYLNNTTILNAICAMSKYAPIEGNVRELFFFQALADSGVSVAFSEVGDFEAEGNIFEVGGQSKTRKQVKNAKKPAYIVKDGIRASSGDEIPLHYFGFLTS